MLFSPICHISLWLPLVLVLVRRSPSLIKGLPSSSGSIGWVCRIFVSGHIGSVSVRSRGILHRLVWIFVALFYDFRFRCFSFHCSRCSFFRYRFCNVLRSLICSGLVAYFTRFSHFLGRRLWVLAIFLVIFMALSIFKICLHFPLLKVTTDASCILFVWIHRPAALLHPFPHSSQVLLLNAFDACGAAFLSIVVVGPSIPFLRFQVLRCFIFSFTSFFHEGLSFALSKMFFQSHSASDMSFYQ